MQTGSDDTCAAPQSAGIELPAVDTAATWSFGTFFKRLGPAGPLAVIAASAPIVAGFTLLGLLPWIGGWLQEHPASGALLYFGCYAVLGGLGFLPTYAYSALGGYAFGFGKGLGLAMASYAAASLIAYIIARRASGDRVVAMISEQPKWKAVYDSLLNSSLGKTLLMVTLLRLPPNSPFALTNLVMAATRVRLPAYLVGTIAGIAPRTGVVVFLAAVSHSVKPGKPMWLFVAGIFLTLVVLGIIGHLANQAIARVTSPQAAQALPAGERPR